MGRGKGRPSGSGGRCTPHAACIVAAACPAYPPPLARLPIHIQCIAVLYGVKSVGPFCWRSEAPGLW